MLQAWREASSHCSPPPRIPQTLIVGTEDARASLSPSFSGLFRRSQSALTCDLSVLRLMKLDPACRCIAVVQNASQLQRIIESVHSPTATNFVVAVVAKSEETICAIRMAALRAGGLGLVAGGKSLLIVQAVLEAWVGREQVESGALRKAFGDACLGKEVVVPPAWDSEAKIRAVTDALRVDYDRIKRTLEAVDKGKLTLPSVRAGEAGIELQTKRDFLQENQNWLREIEDKLRSQGSDGHKLPEGQVEDVTRVSRAAQVPVQSDFFQRLLSERKS